MVRMPALPNEFAHLKGEQQDSLLTRQSYQLRPLARVQMVQILAVQPDTAGKWLEVSARDLEHGGLAGTVRSDDGDNRTGPRGKARGEKLKVREAISNAVDSKASRSLRTPAPWSDNGLSFPASHLKC